MTLSTTTYRAQYSGNGATTVFAVPFYFLTNAHVRVILTSAAGAETVQTLTTHYSLSGAGDENGGSLTMVTAPASGEKLTIVRNIPITQDTDWVNNDPLDAEVLEQAMDKSAMINQQLQEQVDRAMRLPVSVSSSVSTTLPLPAASKFIRWSNDGLSLDNADAVYDNGNFLASGTGAVARTVDSKLGDIVSVKDFGAVGDGVTDNTAKIQAAIDAAAAVGGATVFFPPGIYLISSTLTVSSKGIRLVGSGMYNSTIVKSGTSSDVITFNNAVCDLCEVTDLRITKGASTHTSGFVFKLNTAGALGIKINRVLVEDVYAVLESRPGTLGVNDVIINDCEWLRIEKYGIFAEYAINWCLRQIVIQMNGTASDTAGMAIGSSSEGWLCDSVYVLGGEHSWYFANTLSGTSPKEHTFVHCIGDAAGVACFYMAGLRRSKFLSCWGSSQATASRGVVFDGTDCFGIQWLGGSLVNMAADAMQIINGATRITVANSLFSNWGLDAADTHYGIQVEHNAGTTFRIVDNEFSDDIDLAGNGCWVGVGVNTGTYPKYTIVGNHGNGLTSSVVVDNGTASVAKTVSGNH